MDERRCMWCERIILLGRFCSGLCADAHFAQWEQLDMVRRDRAKKEVCKPT